MLQEFSSVLPKDTESYKSTLYELVRSVLECLGTSYKHSVTLEINFDCLIVSGDLEQHA